MERWSNGIPQDEFYQLHERLAGYAAPDYLVEWDSQFRSKLKELWYAKANPTRRIEIIKEAGKAVRFDQRILREARVAGMTRT
jgi:hypothetical protein